MFKEGWVLGLCLALTACGGGAPALGPPPCDLGPGEVLWSALWVAPPKDQGREWLRLVNHSQRRVRLNRAVVTASGSGAPRRWVLEVQTLGPGETLTLDETRLPGLSLANGAGSVSLSCAGTVVHRVAWGGGEAQMGDGAVWVRDGGAPATAEDAPDWWCPEAQGRAGACGRAFCVDEAGPRAVRAPASARLTEVLADPAGADAGREWVELVADAGDLNALTLVLETPAGQTRRWRWAAGACAPVAGRVRLWLGEGGEGDRRLAGPVLPNGGGRLSLHGGGRELDAVDLPPARTDRSWSRDEAEGIWCTGRGRPDEGVQASPGAPNPPCGAVCWDGSGWRARRDPAPGEVAVVEVMADPAGADAGREWLELVNTGAEAVDLGGLELAVVNGESGRQRGPWPLGGTAACLSLAAGARLLLAGAEADLPEGLSRHVLPSLDLYNTSQTLRLSAPSGLVDEALLPAPESGRALGVAGPDPAAGNDHPDAWCGQRLRQADGSLATPGQDNDPCGAVCLDGSAWRPLQPPEAGALVFTAVAEGAAGPWLELLHLGTRAGDLNGLTVVQENAQGGLRRWQVSARECLSLEPGRHLRLGAGGQALAPPLDLYLKETRIEVLARDVSLATARVPVVRDGVVRLAEPPGDALADDDPAAWCWEGGPGCGP